MRRLALLFLHAFALAGVACAGSSEDASSDEAAIVGGHEEHEYAAAGYLVRDGDVSCTAVLIEKRLVATAAHCTDGIEKLEFGWGEVSAKTKVKVKAVAQHPRYIPPPPSGGVGWKGYDVSFLQLAADAAPEPMAMTTEAVYGQVVGVGYGSTSWAPGADGTYQATGAGLEKKSVDGFVISSNPIETFARYTDGSTCYGDSGGPLVAGGKVAGVLSRFADATRCKPGDHTMMAYTRLDAMSGFLGHARECFGAADVSACLHQPARKLCSPVISSNVQSAPVATATQGDAKNGSVMESLPAGAERAWRFTPSARVHLTLFADGDATFADGTTERDLDANVEATLAVHSCNGVAQQLTLVWQAK